MSQNTAEGVRPPEAWRLKPVYGSRTLLAVLACFVFLVWSAPRVELNVFVRNVQEYVASFGAGSDSSQIGRGLASIEDKMFPLVMDERTPLEAGGEARAWPSRIEEVTRQETALNPETLEIETREIIERYRVQPFGYLLYVCGKMLQSIEMAIWASLFAMIVSLALMPLAARNFTPHPIVRTAARSLVSLLRTIPELVSALFLVLLFGFGPVAGILALTLHSIGFLGKFYADDVETADIRPQEALTALGASRLTVLRLAVLPNVVPSFVALTLYVVDRNIRMATVIGIVGAGGIGQELKGRFDMLQYGHVGTILLVIFATVLALDAFASQVRRHLI